MLEKPEKHEAAKLNHIISNVLWAYMQGLGSITEVSRTLLQGLGPFQHTWMHFSLRFALEMWLALLHKCLYEMFTCGAQNPLCMFYEGFSINDSVQWIQYNEGKCFYCINLRWKGIGKTPPNP